MQHSNPASILEEFIRQETLNAEQNAALARCLQGRWRVILTKHARAAKRRASRLRAEYFLLTGEMYTPPMSRPHVTSCLSALRETALQDAAAAEEYRSAAEKNGSLADLYRRFAAEQDTAARELRRLIIQCF